VGGIGSQHGYFAAVPMVEALENLDCGGLSGSVGPEQGQNLTASDLKINTPYRFKISIRLGQSFDRNHNVRVICHENRS
jgi:hypothetical protein